MLIHGRNRIEPIQFTVVRTRKDSTLLGEMCDRMSNSESIIRLFIRDGAPMYKCRLDNTIYEIAHWYRYVLLNTRKNDILHQVASFVFRHVVCVCESVQEQSIRSVVCLQYCQ